MEHLLCTPVLTTPVILLPRPPKTGLGRSSPLLPLVVTCARLQDAIKVFELNSSFEGVRVDDAHTLTYKAQTAEIDVENDHIYAIVKPATEKHETGVWVGYEWKKIKHNIRPDNSTWMGAVTVQEAIVHMFDRPGFNFPLIALGKPIPAPEVAPPASRSAPAQGTSHTPRTTQPPPQTPRTTRPPPQTPRQRSHGDNRANASEESQEANLLAQLRASLDLGPVRESSLDLQVLRQLVNPLPDPDAPFAPTYRLPISFGEEADEMLELRAVSDSDLLVIPRARVHATNFAAFATHLGLALNWSAAESLALWRAIQLPCVY
ncbi:hypothetical protein C8T65DRAFT_744792 [Cerioporus squamosus]|nr:hypothetical protein C8T65DRAFT_744792 [Cerioporus squamosus]